VGLFLLRIMIRRTHIWIIRIALVATIVFFFNWFFGVMFQCRPPQTFWNDSPLSKKCLGPAAVQGITYTATALTTSVDLTFGVLPMFIVKDLKISIRNKIILCFILGLAMMLVLLECASSSSNADFIYRASVATIIRIPYIKALLKFDADFLCMYPNSKINPTLK
jgi:hypothetical protein